MHHFDHVRRRKASVQLLKTIPDLIRFCPASSLSFPQTFHYSRCYGSFPGFGNTSLSSLVWHSRTIKGPCLSVQTPFPPHILLSSLEYIWPSKCISPRSLCLCACASAHSPPLTDEQLLCVAVPDSYKYNTVSPAVPSVTPSHRYGD